jgi:hypothetical protein
MSDVDDVLRDYAKRWREAQPPGHTPRLPATAPKARTASVRVAATAVGVGVAVVALVVFVASYHPVRVARIRVGTAFSSPAPTAHTSTGPPRPSIPSVPPGWKPVIFESVQFDVPAAWPVYSGGCPDFSRTAVYLGLGGGGSCSSTLEAGTIQIFVVRTVAITPGAVRSTAGGSTIAVRGRAGGPPIGVEGADYVIVVSEGNIELGIVAGQAAQQKTLDQITATISPAPNSSPVVAYPPGPAGTTTTTFPTSDAFCAAIFRFRSAPGATDPSGQPTLIALPYLQQARQAAPPAFIPPLTTIIAWLSAGAHRPLPADLEQAELKSTTQWISACNGRQQ